jgi:hypothetical protein
MYDQSHSQNSERIRRLEQTLQRNARMSYVGAALAVGAVALAGYAVADVLINGPRNKALHDLEVKIYNGHAIRVQQPGVQVPEWNRYHQRELQEAGIDYDLVGEEAIAMLSRSVKQVGDGTYWAVDISGNDLYGGLPDIPFAAQETPSKSGDLFSLLGISEEDEKKVRACVENPECREKELARIKKLVRENKVK